MRNNKLWLISIIFLAAMVLLSACSEDEEKVNTVDEVNETDTETNENKEESGR